MNHFVTIDPTHLSALAHLAHKEDNRHDAMRGVAIDAKGRMAATDGKIAGRLGALEGTVIVVPTAEVKALGAMAKSPKRGPKLMLTLSGAWEPGALISARVHREDDADATLASKTFTAPQGTFPATEAVYKPETAETTTVGLDFALLERVYKAAKALGHGVGRVSFALTDAKCKPVRVEFRTDSGVLEVLVMPVRLAD